MFPIHNQSSDTIQCFPFFGADETESNSFSPSVVQCEGDSVTSNINQSMFDDTVDSFEPITQRNAEQINPFYDDYKQKAREIASKPVFYGDDMDLFMRAISKIKKEELFSFLQTTRIDGQTILHVLAEKGKVATIISLLKELQPNERFELLKLQNGLGATVLHWLRCYDQLSNTQWAWSLFDIFSIEQQSILLDIKDAYGRIPLFDIFTENV